MALYSEKVMDHFTNPRNVGKIDDADGVGEVGNAKCGDIMKIYLKIDENQIQNTFHLLGKKENPYPYIKKANYFCLLSKFEGYGMVLEEAKILGKNILITDTAAREAVENYGQAVVIPNDEENIYQTLKEVIKKGKINQNNIQQNYDNKKIIEKQS